MTVRGQGGRLLVLLAAVGGARALYAAMNRVPPGEPALWERRNHRGRVVTLYQGPAVAAAVATAVGAAPQLPPRLRAAAALATVAAAGCGSYDDMLGGPERGLRAHLGALRGGRVTTGAVKLAGIGSAAVVAACLVQRRPVDRLLAATVIAGTAGAVNLLDVRPGRAAGAVLAAGLPTVLRGGPGAAVAAAPVGAAAALLPEDRGERTMLGDCGAHALGAVLGTAWAAGSGRAALALRAAALLCFHAAAELGLYGEP
ncbi:hypothetical protein [Peterkaempfera griseoplana]|uniref:hypothetical protein n=1 Tax=Peterkaempfera griseoplana TaxID=66896 RepID=UPI0006E3AD5C|nr:hypothetical protein [Peterkaempfera griseoplana]